MDLKLYNNLSENNKINKVLSNETVLTGSLRKETSVLYPEILVEASSVVNFNYAYIPLFDRYYFIDKITSYRTNLWLVNFKVDVLQSFSSSILNLSCIIDSTEEYKGDNYLLNESWVNKVKDKTDIINFSNGLSENGEFILITAGGGS